MKKKTKVYVLWDFDLGEPVYSENNYGSLLVFFSYPQAEAASKNKDNNIAPKEYYLSE